MSSGTITKLTTSTVALGANVTEPTLDLLTAMGHGNGSGATEEFTNLPGYSALVVENFGDPGDPITTKLNLAIPAAKAAGIRYVVLRDTSLPYDATLVAFDSAVRVVREGQGSWDEYDARAHGASITGSDGYAGLQAAADAIPAAGGIVRLQDGTHRYSRPLWLKQHGTRLLGSAGYKPGADPVPCSLRPSYRFGPAVVVAPATASVDGLSAALVSGTGASWKPADNTHYYNLRDAATLDLHGLPAFTFECYYRPDDVTGNAILWGSRGKWLNYETAGTAVEIQVQSGGQPLARLTTSSGGTTTITSADSLTPAIVYHIAFSWDGANMYLFVDGVQKATAAKTGTIVQQDAEDCPLGPSFEFSPECTLSNAGPHGPLYSVNILKICKYTAGFTKPTAAFSNTNDTLMLLNWDLNVGPMTRGQTYLGDAWLLERRSYVLNGAEISGVGVFGGVANSVTGILFAPGCANHAEVSNFQAVNCRNGIMTLSGPGIPCHMHDLHITSSRYGLCLAAGTAFLELHSININNTMLPLWLGCSAAIVDNFEVICDSSTVFGGILTNFNTGGALYHVRTFVTNTENGVGTKWRGALAIGGTGLPQAGALIESCALGTGNSAPFLLVDHTDDVVVRGSGFVFSTGSPSTVMQAKGTLSRPVKFDACWRTGATVPWTDVPGTAIVGAIGKGTAVTYSATPTLDCSLRDGFELSATLSGDIAPTFTNMTPKQEITLLVKQDGSGGHAVNFGSEVKLATAVDTVANHYSLWTFEVALDGKLYQKSFASGT